MIIVRRFCQYKPSLIKQVSKCWFHMNSLCIFIIRLLAFKSRIWKKCSIRNTKNYNDKYWMRINKISIFFKSISLGRHNFHFSNFKKISTFHIVHLFIEATKTWCVHQLTYPEVILISVLYCLSNHSIVFGSNHL